MPAVVPESSITLIVQVPRASSSQLRLVVKTQLLKLSPVSVRSVARTDCGAAGRGQDDLKLAARGVRCVEDDLDRLELDRIGDGDGLADAGGAVVGDRLVDVDRAGGGA